MQVVLLIVLTAHFQVAEYTWGGLPQHQLMWRLVPLESSPHHGPAALNESSSTCRGANGPSLVSCWELACTSLITRASDTAKSHNNLTFAETIRAALPNTSYLAHTRPEGADLTAERQRQLSHQRWD